MTFKKFFKKAAKNLKVATPFVLAIFPLGGPLMAGLQTAQKIKKGVDTLKLGRDLIKSRKTRSAFAKNQVLSYAKKKLIPNIFKF
jgi:hypothetical protein